MLNVSTMLADVCGNFYIPLFGLGHLAAFVACTASSGVLQTRPLWIGQSLPE